MASRNRNSDDSSYSHAPLSQSSSSSLSTSETDYCIRTINYLTAALKLSIPQLKSLKFLTLNILLKIHCSLLGISYSKEFIPSTHPREDAERMILSLKDKFGSDKFGALDAEKIANKDPTQLRFLLENFHLILNHKLTKSTSKYLKSSYDPVKSRSGNHLSVWKPSTSYLQQDSFYVLPGLPIGENGFNEKLDLSSTNEVDTDDTFETMENIVVKVFEETASEVDESSNDEITISRSSTGSLAKALSASSPVERYKYKSKHHSPNMSSITRGQSEENIFPQVKDSKSNSTILQRSQSSRRDSNVLTKLNNDLKVLAKNENFDRSNVSVSAIQNTSMPDGESSQSEEILREMTDMHSEIRNQITESLITLDNDISKLKRKPTSSKPSIPRIANSQYEAGARKPLPNLRWMLPVDARFPNYTKGTIIPKCTSFITKRGNKIKGKPSLTKKMTVIVDKSTVAQRKSTNSFDQFYQEEE